MNRRETYRLVGAGPGSPPTAPNVTDASSAAVAAATSTGVGIGMRVFIFFTVVGLLGLLAVSGIVGWSKISLDDGLGRARQDLVAVNISLANRIVDTNISLCNKIMEVNTTLQSEVDVILQAFEASNTSFYFDLSQAINDTNTTLCAKIMDGDSLLQMEINNLTDVANSKVSTMNGVTGDPTIRNIELTANGTGISIQPNPMLYSISLENTGVVTINSVPSFVGSHDLLVTGMGMININSFPLSSTVEVDGTPLSTALSNLQMQNNMQQMEIANLEGNVTNLQTQITNLQMAGDMIAQDLNGTTITFNMTLMTLVMDVMTLQSQVAALQMQVLSLTSAAVPPGTITPFGGTVIPVGYLACDGAEYDTVTYAALFTVIGTMYCPGPCTNMSVFAVPDLRGRVPAGQGGTALSGTLGSSVGAETHTLTAGQMPTHSHSGVTNVDGNHGHQWMVQAGVGTNPIDGGHLNEPCCYNGNCNTQPQTVNAIPTQCANDYIGSGNGYYNKLATNIDVTYYIPGWGGDGFFNGGKFPPSDASHQHGFATNNAGSSQAHNNIQPSLIVKYIIKT